MSIAKRAYYWACQKTSTPFAPLWLAVIFLSEIFLFLPMDALLMIFCLQNPQKRFVYALVATLSSVVAGLIGYFVGFWVWDAVGGFVMEHFVSKNFFNHLVAHYNQYESIAVFIGSFLPIPFKAVTVSAGVCHLSLGGFLAALCLARALRFFLIAELMYRWGDSIKLFIDKHFNRLLVAIGAKVALTFAFFWILGS